jgi:hypothetical protein
MAYSAEISRVNPACFLFLIDQSGSMDDAMSGADGTGRKADFLADAINKLLSNLAVRSAKEEGVRDYFHVGVLGYGASVGPAWSGSLAGRELVPISEIATQPARVEERAKKLPDGAGGLVEQSARFPVWFDPTASGGTPMSQALTQAQSIVGSWLSEHPDSYPPLVINITDGEATDGDPSAPAEAIRGLASSDGNAILFNLHLSSVAAAAIHFPDSDGALPDQYARQLFHMSSVLPGAMRTAAQQEGFSVTDGSRGFVFNADAVAVIQFLDIGTRTSELR